MADTKYNTLSDFHDFLLRGCAPSTAATYKKAVDFLLDEQYLIDWTDMDINSVIDKLQGMKYKNQYSKYKNAFLKFCDFLDIKLSNDILLKLDIANLDKKKKYRKMEPRKLEDIKNHLRGCKDKKLKLSYETMLATGLRVSELSQIKKTDCIVSNNNVQFFFTGKGQKKESVTINKADNMKLYTNLVELITGASESKKVFYSTNYLQTKASDMGFNCHDLRRAFAKITRKNNKDINVVKDAMRHTSTKNTKIYLNSKIDI